MKDLALTLLRNFVIELMSTAWFFIRPVLYLYLIWLWTRIADLVFN